jgi:hypothetical protein
VQSTALHSNLWSLSGFALSSKVPSSALVALLHDSNCASVSFKSVLSGVAILAVTHSDLRALRHCLRDG